MKLYELTRGSRFTFQQDTNRPKDIYWFKGMDGAYGQIFSTEADMKAFKKPAFVSASSIVDEVTDG